MIIKNIRIVFGLNIKLIILALLAFSCSNNNIRTIEKESVININNKLTYYVNYENLFTNFYLINGSDTLDKVIYNSAYGKPKVSKNDNLYIAELAIKGGIGMKRRNTLIFKEDNNKLKLIFEFQSLEKFKDKMFEADYYLDSCTFKLKRDSVLIDEFVIENNDTLKYNWFILKDHLDYVKGFENKKGFIISYRDNKRKDTKD